MRVLLDECVPRRLRQSLKPHYVRTVPEMGWAAAKNGALLSLATGHFDIFLTTDQSLSYQQAVRGREIGVIVLIARRNKVSFLLPLVPELLRVMEELLPGEVRLVGG